MINLSFSKTLNNSDVFIIDKKNNKLKKCNISKVPIIERIKDIFGFGSINIVKIHEYIKNHKVSCLFNIDERDNLINQFKQKGLISTQGDEKISYNLTIDSNFLNIPEFLTDLIRKLNEDKITEPEAKVLGRLLFDREHVPSDFREYFNDLLVFLKEKSRHRGSTKSQRMVYANYLRYVPVDIGDENTAQPRWLQELRRFITRSDNGENLDQELSMHSLFKVKS